MDGAVLGIIILYLVVGIGVALLGIIPDIVIAVRDKFHHRNREPYVWSNEREKSK